MPTIYRLGSCACAGCSRRGFKLVIAAKAWHGAFSKTSEERFDYGSGGAFDTISGDTTGSICTCLETKPKPNPDQVKFRTLSVDSSYNYSAHSVPGGEDLSRSAEVSYAISVGRLTGLRAISMCSQTSAGALPGGADAALAAAWANRGIADWTLADMEQQYCQAPVSADWPGGDPPNTFMASGSGGAWTYTMTGNDGNVYATLNIDVVAGTFAARYYGLVSSVLTLITSIDVAVTSASVHWHRHQLLYGSETGTFDQDVVGTLGDPYYATDVNSDANCLLALWDLTNDSQLPWNTADNYSRPCNIGRLVVFNERSVTAPVAEDVTPYDPGNPDTTGCNWTDPTSPYDPSPGAGTNHCSGRVLGAPDDPVTPRLSDGYNGPQGSYVSYASGTSSIGFGGTFSDLPSAPTALGCLVKAKWAEMILRAVPAHNFARPCGPDDAVETAPPDCAVPRWADGWTDTGGAHHSGVPLDCNCHLGLPGYPNCDPPAGPWVWNDATQKGTYCLRLYTYDARDVGENERQHNDHVGKTPPCDPVPDPTPYPLRGPAGAQVPLKALACSQEVAGGNIPVYVYPANIQGNATMTIGATPYAVSFYGGTGGQLLIDEHYGTQWQLFLAQWMTDPLYSVCQPDMPPTEGTGEPHYVECLCSAPAGSPAMPTDAVPIGCSGYLPAVWAGTAPPNPECAPPSGGVCTIAPWDLIESGI